MFGLSSCILAIFLAVISWIYYYLFYMPKFSTLLELPGPEKRKGILGLGGHMDDHLKLAQRVFFVLFSTDSSCCSVRISKVKVEENTKKYGRTYRIEGVGHVCGKLNHRFLNVT